MRRSKWQKLFILLLQDTIWSPAGVRKKFFCPEKCTLHANNFFSQTQQVWATPHDASADFPTAYSSHYILLLPLPTSCLSVSFFVLLFFFISYPLSLPLYSELYMYLGLGDLRIVSVPSPLLVYWPPIPSCHHFFCPAINKDICWHPRLNCRNQLLLWQCCQWGCKMEYGRFYAI